jgi:hypothetical protein
MLSQSPSLKYSTDGSQMLENLRMSEVCKISTAFVEEMAEKRKSRE